MYYLLFMLVLTHGGLCVGDFLKIVSWYFVELNLWKSQGWKLGVAFLQGVFAFDSEGSSELQLTHQGSLKLFFFRTVLKAEISGVIPTPCNVPPGLSGTGAGICPCQLWLLCLLPALIWAHFFFFLIPFMKLQQNFKMHVSFHQDLII